MFWFLLALAVIMGYIWYDFKKQEKLDKELEEAVSRFERKVNELIKETKR